MKNRQKHIEQEVNKTLQYLENEEYLKADGFFHTRLLAKIENRKTERPSILEFLPGKYLKPVLIALIVILNIGTVLYLFSGAEKNTETVGDTTRDEYLQLFADEYGMNDNNVSVTFYSEEK